MSRKGIVCEIKKEYCVFLTADGQFVRGIPADPASQVGDEAEFREYVHVKKSPMKRTLVPLASVAALFLLLFTTVLNPLTTVHAYVQVNGVDSVEFGVNENGQVVKVRQLSEVNGVKQTESYKGKPVEEAIEEILTASSIKTDPVTITTVYTDRAEENTTKITIEKAITNVKQKFIEQKVSIYEASEEEREKANEKGQTIQKHLNQTKTPQNGKDKNSKLKKNHSNNGKDTSKNEKNPKSDENSNPKHQNNGEEKTKSQKNEINHPSHKIPPGKEKKEDDQKVEKQEQKENHNNEQKNKEKQNKEKEDQQSNKNKEKEKGQGQKKGNGKD